MCLASEKFEVPHLRSTEFYRCILEGRKYVQRVKKAKFKLVAEDDMDAGAEKANR